MSIFRIHRPAPSAACERNLITIVLKKGKTINLNNQLIINSCYSNSEQKPVKSFCLKNYSFLEISLLPFFLCKDTLSLLFLSGSDTSS